MIYLCWINVRRCHHLSKPHVDDMLIYHLSCEYKTNSNVADGATARNCFYSKAVLAGNSGEMVIILS